MADSLGDGPFERLKNLLILLVEGFLGSYQVFVIVAGILFILLIGGLLVLFR